MSKPLEPTLVGVCTFATNSAQCGSGSYDPVHVTTICAEMLEQAVKTLKANPGARIKVVGNHNAEESAKIASKRADAVASKLVKEYAVKASQITKTTGTTGNRTVQIYVLPE